MSLQSHYAIKEDDYSREVNGMHLQKEVDESHQQASRPDCIFCMSRQNLCQRTGPLTIPLLLECVTLDGLFIKCFIFLSICSEDKVIEHYKKLKGLTRGQAIVQ